ncbi:unnamed protein product [Musa hybrid cultivar]
MGALRRRVSAEELREVILRSCGVGGGCSGRKAGPGGVRRRTGGDGTGWEEGRVVCVTGGVSFVGSAIARRLLARGYAVRLLVDTQEDLEKLREKEMFQGGGVWAAAVANVMDLDSLCRAFDGCTAVFHSSSSVDPRGISGYSKHMVDVEVRATERVIEACVRTESVRKCVFTSSLLACVWRQRDPCHARRATIVDDNCWSDETICRDRKLWFALGKTMAEKAAWRVARGRDLNLVTVCPALVTGPGFQHLNPTGSIAYLKGAQYMFAAGLLATVDVEQLADAHVSIYEAMNRNASGRYICYDHVIQTGEEAAELERQLRLPNRVRGATRKVDPTSFELSNRKLLELMNSRRRCTYDVYSYFP